MTEKLFTVIVGSCSSVSHRSVHQKTLFNSQSDQALVQVARGACGASIPGNIQNCLERALSNLYLILMSRGLDYMIFRDATQPHTLCGSSRCLYTFWNK